VNALTGDDAVIVARRYWALMADNDWRAVADALFADDFRLDWPQSNERIVGRDNFVRLNAEYPAAGLWTFDVQRIVGSEREAVSDVLVSDGVRRDRALTFFTLDDAGRIRQLIEYWPEPFPAPQNRSHLTEPIRR